MGFSSPSNTWLTFPSLPHYSDSSRYIALQEATSEGVRATLVVEDAEQDDFGVYNCTARNSYGVHSGTVYLKRQREYICTCVCI